MPIRVLAAVVERSGKYLVCRRPPHKRHGGLWEFPGGKMEPGESELDAAARELDEELGVRVSHVGELRFAAADPGSDFVIEFFNVGITGEPEPKEHSELRWVAPADMHALDLAPSDRRFAIYIGSEGLR